MEGEEIKKKRNEIKNGIEMGKCNWGGEYCGDMKKKRS